MQNCVNCSLFVLFRMREWARSYTMSILKAVFNNPQHQHPLIAHPSMSPNTRIPRDMVVVQDFRKHNLLCLSAFWTVLKSVSNRRAPASVSGMSTAGASLNASPGKEKFYPSPKLKSVQVSQNAVRRYEIFSYCNENRLWYRNCENSCIYSAAWHVSITAR
jgi:hypothetical protein